MAGLTTTVNYNVDGLPEKITYSQGEVELTIDYPSTHGVGELAWNMTALQQAFGRAYGYEDRSRVRDRFYPADWSAERYRYDKAGRLTAVEFREYTDFTCTFEPDTGLSCTSPWPDSEGGGDLERRRHRQGLVAGDSPERSN